MKLIDKDIIEIKKYWEQGEKLKDIGKLYGVTKQTIQYHLKKYGCLGKNWESIKEKKDTIRAIKMEKKYGIIKNLSALERKVHRNLMRIKYSCKNYGIQFNLRLVDLLPLPSVCPILGIELSYFNNIKAGSRDCWATIDRIEPNKGYIKGNVHIISFRANRIKNNATIKELKLISEYFDNINILYLQK